MSKHDSISPTCSWLLR